MLVDIAVHGDNGPVTVSDISRRLDLPVKYLEKLVRLLKKGDYIQSKRGPRGGHMLAKAPEDITMGEIVRQLEGDFCLVDCANHGQEPCPNMESCPTRMLWTRATDAMLRELDGITLRELVDNHMAKA
jgi:Rrf2 family protein